MLIGPLWFSMSLFVDASTGGDLTGLKFHAIHVVLPSTGIDADVERVRHADPQSWACNELPNVCFDDPLNILNPLKYNAVADALDNK